MPEYCAALTIILLVGMVLTRAFLRKQHGIKALKFGNIDKKDFLIPPFALFYFYSVFAEAFHLPAVSRQEFFQSEFRPWIGVVFCTAGLGRLLWRATVLTQRDESLQDNQSRRCFSTLQFNRAQ